MQYLETLADYVRNGPKHNGIEYSIYYLANSCNMYDEIVEIINTIFPNIIFVWKPSPVVEAKIQYYAEKKYYTWYKVNNKFGNFLICITNQIRNQTVSDDINAFFIYIGNKTLAFYYNYSYGVESHHNFYPKLYNYDDKLQTQCFSFPFSLNNSECVYDDTDVFCITENTDIQIKKNCFYLK